MTDPTATSRGAVMSQIARSRCRDEVFAVAIVCLISAACSEGTPTSPTTTSTTTTTVAEPTITEEFSGTLPVGGSSFYSYRVGENGTVNVTLTSVSGVGIPSTVWVGLGIGTPSGEGCATTTTINGPAGSTPQITGTYAPTIYCVRIDDLGNLAGPARFSITIAHP